MKTPISLVLWLAFFGLNSPMLASPSPPAIRIADAGVVEGDAGRTNLIFVLTLSPAQTNDISLSYYTADGTAKAGLDYFATNGSLTFPAGALTQFVIVPVIGETLYEPDETLFVYFTNNPTPPGVVIINGSFEFGNSPGTSININAPDNTTIQGWAVTSGSIDYIGSRWTAGDGSRCLDLSGVSAGAIRQTVAGFVTGAQYELSFLVAGNPELSGIKRLQASVGATSQSYSFDSTGATTTQLGWTQKTLDFVATSPSMDVTFTSQTSGNAGPALDLVNITPLQNVGITLSNTFATGVITNDDPLPRIFLEDRSFPEGDIGTNLFQVNVTLSNPSVSNITVGFTMVDGTATDGSDYVSKGGMLQFPPGVTNQAISVYIIGDTNDEPDETFFVHLNNPVNAALGKTNGIVTILDDDPPQIRVADAAVLEGNTGLTDLVFTFALSSANAQTVTVDFQTTDGTALTGSDYLSTNGTVTFPPGQTNASVTVKVIGDLTREPDETFFLCLTNPAYATLPRTKIPGTILNDDFANVPPTVSITNPADGTIFYAPTGPISITADARDSDGFVQLVDFYCGTNSVYLGSATNAPFTLQWSTNLLGSVLLTAVAMDDAGATSTSAPVHIQILPCSGTLTASPLVNQTACACEAVMFSTTVTSPDPVSFVWRANGQVIPGQTNSNLLLQSLKPSHAGVYSVELSSPCERLTNSATLAIGGDGLQNPLVLSNSNVITINDYTTATPYPAFINVSCVPGVVQKVTVHVFALSHTSTHDIDMLLANPNNTGIKLMSDAGRSASNVDLTFSDSATAVVPAFPGVIFSGSYHPTDYGVPSDDSFPANISYITNLAGFKGVSPNGSWGLYVRDDEFLDTGVIAGGWSMTIDWDDSAPRLIFPTILVDGRFQMNLISQPGRTHLIEGSPDLHSWFPLSTNTMIGTNMPLVFDAAPASARRFFRVLRCPHIDLFGGSAPARLTLPRYLGGAGFK